MKFNDASLLFSHEVCVKWKEVLVLLPPEFGGTGEIVGTVHLPGPTSVLLFLYLQHCHPISCKTLSV